MGPTLPCITWRTLWFPPKKGLPTHYHDGPTHNHDGERDEATVGVVKCFKLKAEHFDLGFQKDWSLNLSYAKLLAALASDYSIILKDYVIP